MNRALLVGINKYRSAPLNGCVNDVVDMAEFLNKKCGFAKKEIRLLVDERATKEEIVSRLGWLLSGARSGDRILFHFSGHGVQMPSRNVQGEIDGLDEAICPVDFDWSDARSIRDKEFNKIFSTVPSGVGFIWISDSCHSGDLWKLLPRENQRPKTMPVPVDINWRMQTAIENKIPLRKFSKTAAELNLALITGCKADQTSADAIFNNRYNGALTYFLLDKLKGPEGLKTPLTSLIKNVQAALKDGFEQEPQLEGSAIIKEKAFLEI